MFVCLVLLAVYRFIISLTFILSFTLIFKMKNKNKVCAIATCSSPNDITYFSFPKEDERQKVWLEKCHRSDPVNIKNARICEIHFSEEYFMRDFQHELLGLPLRRRLSLSAIPSLHIPHQEPQSLSDFQLEGVGVEEIEVEDAEVEGLDDVEVQEVEVEEVDVEQVEVGDVDGEDVEVEDVNDLQLLNEGEVDNLRKDQETQCSIKKGFPQIFYYNICV